MVNKNEKEINISDVIRNILNQRKNLIKWGCIGLIAGLIVAFSIPKEYQSVVKIAPEKKDNRQSMAALGGFASMMGVDLGSSTGGITENLYPDIVQTDAFLREFANIEVKAKGAQTTLSDYLLNRQSKAWWIYIVAIPSKILGLLSNSDDEAKKVQDNNPYLISKPERRFINELDSRTQIDYDKKTGIIRIAVKMQDPMCSALIADSMVTKLKRYIVHYQTSKARKVLENSELMFTEAKHSYYKADSAYAALLDRNQGLSSMSAKVKLERLMNEKNLAFSVYQQLAGQVEVNKIKLQEDTPVATVFEPATAPLRAISPNKPIVLAVFIILGLFVAVAFISAKTILQNEEIEDNTETHENM